MSDCPNRTRDSLEAQLVAYEGHWPTRVLWNGSRIGYAGPCDLSVSLSTGEVRLGSTLWGRSDAPISDCRFCWRLRYRSATGRMRARTTGHYRLLDRVGDREYFEGGNYVDYEAQSGGDNEAVVAMLAGHRAEGPVLEIGCATGSLLAAFQSRGIESFGADVSPWAVERATALLGPNRVWICDVERSALPEGLLQHAPFGMLILHSVFEHFREPFVVLERLAPVCRPDTVLFLVTSNAASLTHQLFGSDWEGYFDPTHFGVNQVDVSSLRRQLPALGWRIASLSTELIWDANIDPVHATLRDWWTNDARFRALLGERDLGDLITCVAVRS